MLYRKCHLFCKIRFYHLSNFTEEEVEAILESSNDLSWERAEGADAEVVVQALSLAKNEQADLDGEENAELSLALAQNARLFPARRGDRGRMRSITDDQIDALMKLRQDNPKLSTPRLVEKANLQPVAG